MAQKEYGVHGPLHLDMNESKKIDLWFDLMSTSNGHDGLQVEFTDLKYLETDIAAKLRHLKQENKKIKQELDDVKKEIQDLKAHIRTMDQNIIHLWNKSI